MSVRCFQLATVSFGSRPFLLKKIQLRRTEAAITVFVFIFNFDYFIIANVYHFFCYCELFRIVFVCVFSSLCARLRFCCGRFSMHSQIVAGFVNEFETTHWNYHTNGQVSGFSYAEFLLTVFRSLRHFRPLSKKYQRYSAQNTWQTFCPFHHHITIEIELGKRWCGRYVLLFVLFCCRRSHSALLTYTIIEKETF